MVPLTGPSRHQMIDAFDIQQRPTQEFVLTAPTNFDYTEIADAPAYDTPLGITNPPIDELLERASSKYALVIFAAKRARQINDYYNQLGDGILEYVGPLVEPGLHAEAAVDRTARDSTPTCSSTPRASSHGGMTQADQVHGAGFSSASAEASRHTRCAR